MWRGLWWSVVVVGALLWGGPVGAEPLGGACARNPECDAASGYCLQEHARGSDRNIWVGGYCSRDCAAAGSCPTGSSCIRADNGAYCLKQCNPTRPADCRAQYVCESTSAGDSVCVSICGDDTDCASGFTCRSCDGRCIARQKPGVLIGDPCSEDAQCGTSQTCLKVNGSPQGVCSQACGGSGCASTCPTGSTCQKVGSLQASMCVRACSPDSCGASLQCSPFPPSATGCLPPCRTSADCPTGSTCGGQGQCVTEGASDAGCPLCGGPPDAGPSPSVDAGTGSPGGTGVGCGCQSSFVHAPGFLGALVVFFVAARRRRCQRP